MIASGSLKLQVSSPPIQQAAAFAMPASRRTKSPYYYIVEQHLLPASLFGRRAQNRQAGPNPQTCRAMRALVKK
jgi:hypothetical protein